ncbi:Non-catalytic module family DOC2 [Piromyces sp. E2]|nr:Non-catalytic module family DOC2 [Piromyces sp. E2]|eukprot:OUM65419.1 Non-catalytic module family DOC2 [Piromyces sp. E2]
MGSPLPDYTPDRNYSDDRVPVLGVNQYNLERKSSNNKSNESNKQSNEQSNEQCWSESLGYKCCSNKCNAKVVTIDNNGYWGAENGEWY